MAITRVKYSCLFLLFCSVSLLSFGQSGSPVSIFWRKPIKFIDTLNVEVNVLNFKGAHYLKENKYQPSVRIQIPGTVSDFKISKTTVQSLTPEEQKIKIPTFSTPLYKIKYGQLNGKPYSFVYFVPLQYSAGAVEKITYFEYTVQFSSTPATSTNHINASRLKLASSANSSSLLSSGDWYKLNIPNTGLYKIDYSFLQNLGINPSNISPSQIQIFGNGGGMLPQLNSAFRYDDITEYSIYSSDKNGNNVFDGDDYVLFYAQGPHTWKYDQPSKRFVQTTNIYSDASYCYLTVGFGAGLRIQDQTTPAGSPNQTINTFDERIHHEFDAVSVNHSGREWYGETFDYELNKTFTYSSLSGIVPNTNCKVTSFVMARSNDVSWFTFTINRLQVVKTQYVGKLLTGDYVPVGTNQIDTFNFNFSPNPSSTIEVTYDYNKGSQTTAVGYLNYFDLTFKRNLSIYNNYTSFRSVSAIGSSPSLFNIGGASNQSMIWDVTNSVHPQKINYTLSGTDASFVAATDTLREYIAFSGTGFPNPGFSGKVSSQNLHSIGSSSAVPDMIIIAHPNFLNAAHRLADYKRTHDNLDVEVVTPNLIYNEFSSGAQDLTALRDFAKMVYYRSTPSDSLKYILLVGDCSYDYKSRVAENTNYVPVYESFESLHPINSHSSDDYIGFYDPLEGAWLEDDSDPEHTLEVGIGRLPVKSASEAEDAVNKIIHYSSSDQCFGKWRNKVTFMADDGDGNLHLGGADNLADMVGSIAPVYNINKIYLDAYPQIASPGGESAPQCKEAITQAVEKGTFILNYTGHGGEQILAQEVIIDVPQIESWSNYNAMPFFVTATCDFGRYDDPSVVSGAEHSLLNNKGGSIGNICSTRPVYSDHNDQLNEAFYDFVFKPIQGKMPRLGDVIRSTKNQSASGIYNRNYALLGDPSLRLAYPEDNIAITKVNGKAASAADTIRALSKVSLEGEVRDNLGSKLTDFNGTINITVYDKASTIQTFGTQGSAPTTFKLKNNLIFEGVANVTNGAFSIEFVVPKDISYQFDKGKISLYSKKDGAYLDAAGFNVNIVIGGTDTNYTSDNTPPKIKLFMNDESFVFGGLTTTNSLLLAKISDENGINIAGQGIGHEITAVLDNSNQVIVLNDYYTTEKNTYKQGSVQYPLKGLSPGNHSIKFKCWDTYNNSSESYLEFIVANDAHIALSHVLNYPNPFSSFTTFHFDHNRAGDDIDVLVQIFTISGKLIRTLDSRAFISGSHFSDLSWDGRDDFGDKIGKGIYVYKVKVRSLRDGSEGSKFEKLVLLN